MIIWHGQNALEQTGLRFVVPLLQTNNLHEVITGVAEDYYDQAILSNCTSHFRRAIRVIGRTMAKTDQLVGDTFINYRVRVLIDTGKLEYRGKLVMRDFEIRMKGGFHCERFS